ncbi:rho GTPase-activating protein 27 isoform X2 [Engraulis encrasicolus]|uniref:rho GTPase-activating protein 27 isoform X2 n=1 Tax=Engraulis encrasicolus TaxID=184585 RepID=UPI002FD06AE0
MAASPPELKFVKVLFPYEYTARDGRRLSIQPGERYSLLSRTNSHWWHVRPLQDASSKPFYVPARYVEEVQYQGAPDATPSSSSLSSSSSSKRDGGSGIDQDTLNVSSSSASPSSSSSSSRTPERDEGRGGDGVIVTGAIATSAAGGGLGGGDCSPATSVRSGPDAEGIAPGGPDAVARGDAYGDDGSVDPSTPVAEVTPCWLTPTEERGVVELATSLREVEAEAEAEGPYENSLWLAGIAPPQSYCSISSTGPVDSTGIVGSPSQQHREWADMDNGNRDPTSSGRDDAAHKNYDVNANFNGHRTPDPHQTSSIGYSEYDNGQMYIDPDYQTQMDTEPTYDRRIEQSYEQDAQQPTYDAEMQVGLPDTMSTAGLPQQRDLVADGVYESIDSLQEEDALALAGLSLETPGVDMATSPVVVKETDTHPQPAPEQVRDDDDGDDDESPVYVNLPPFRRKPGEPPFDSSEPYHEPNHPQPQTHPHPRLSPSNRLSRSPEDLDHGRDLGGGGHHDLGSALRSHFGRRSDFESRSDFGRDDSTPAVAVAQPGGGGEEEEEEEEGKGGEGWEVHVDEESGQEFYFHPASGETTWDRPPAMDAPTATTSLPVTRLEEPRLPQMITPRRTPTHSPSQPYPTGYPSPPSPSTPPAGLPPTPPLASSPPAWRASDWQRLVDEGSGRSYYYNHASGETSWDPPEGVQTHRRDEGPPPLPEEDYPAEDVYTACLEDDAPSGGGSTGVPVTTTVSGTSGGAHVAPSEYSLAHVSRSVIPRASLDRSTPPGWTLHVDQEGMWVFTSEHTQEQWIKSLDDRGQTYYYLRDGSRSQWTLPEVSQSQSRVGNGSSELDGSSVMRNWRHSVVPSSTHDELKFHPTHRRNLSDYGSDMSSSPDGHSQLPSLEKAGILNKTKVSENGKKVRKNWGQSWTVLHGGVLTFHKDPKSAPSSTSMKSNQILPEFTVDLRGATLTWAAKDKSSKKNVIELKSQNGCEYLIQYDTESIISDWHKVILDTIRQLEQEQHHSDEEDDVYEKMPGVDDRPSSGQDKKRVVAPKPSFTGSTSEHDQKKVKTKLRKFLLKRPTLQSVKDKGYIRENVFGCHLANLCAQERTTVPVFVEKCIRTVEKRGLGIDGLYRVSGNLATIQKLRFKADHEDIDFEEGHWDIHVITGALKLFFRELQEPLFPYSHFNNFVAGIKIADYHEKVSYMSELVRSLPAENHDTMETLFRHLRNVIEHGEENRMTVQNIAIVFGPTLLKPEMESANITMFMVFQNQIVEFVLNEFDNLFYSR